MKKATAALLLFISALLLCGCVRVDITAELRADNTAQLNYMIAVDTVGMNAEEAEQALDALEYLYSHFDRMGYETKLEGGLLTAAYNGSYESAQSAAEAFISLLQNEKYSPFTGAGMSYDIGGASGYSFSGSIDMNKIADAQAIASLPTAVVSDPPKAGDIAGSITVILPSDDGSGSVTKELYYGQTTDISVSSVYTADGAERTAAEQRQRAGLIAVIAGGAACVMLIVIIIVISGRKKSKTHKNQQKTDNY